MSLSVLFRTMDEFFRRENLEYALIGAFALFGFGYFRATRDVDFVTRLQNQSKIGRFLDGLGFETTHLSNAFSNHVHPVGGVRIDILYVDGTTADEIFSATRHRIIFDEAVFPVVSPEHLAAMKLFAAANDPDRRLKDLSDVRELVRRTPINRDALRGYFEKYGLEKYYDEVTG